MRVYLSKYQMGFALNEQEASVYVALKIMYDRMLDKDRKVITYANVQSIYYELSGSFDVPKKTAILIKEGLQGLIDTKVVNVIDSDGKGNYMLDITNLKIQEKGEPYTIMTTYEIRKIYSLQHKNKMNLLRFAVALFGTIHCDYQCGYASFDYLVECSNVNLSSCKAMFKLLEDNKIIYVRHANNAKRDTNGQIKNLSNVYGRPEHIQEINDYFGKRCAKEGYDFTNKMSSNRKGQTTRRYNKYVDGKFNGEIEELKFLIKECLTYNQQYYMDNQPESRKDMSVFPADLVEECEKELGVHIKEEQKKQRKFEAKRKEKEMIENARARMIGRMAEINKKIEENRSKYEELDDDFDF